jgi:eukaryotic-like serine/threonine-protein kinase
MMAQTPTDPPPEETPADDALDAALAAAFGPDAVLPVPVGDPEDRTLPPAVRPDPGERPAEDAPRDPAARYQLHGEIARGGMGAVLKGRDTDLGRDIAVKVLLETHQDKDDLRRRFVEEARIAGRLQHPGVVPVYDLGRLPDRRPYFTMKLVQGRTLAALLAERPDLARDRPRFLKVFEQVCQTVAYAHTRGVIHRDLKPSNVMVGSFGEVQVMDWGVAKVLSGSGAAPADRKERPRDGDGVPDTAPGKSADTDDAGGPRTRAGSVLGTLAYMPPEQARGDADRLDERCDVFGLGAILCEILTGQPPYAGGDSMAVYDQAVRGDLTEAFARLDGCGADPDLIGLARRCLAAAPADRPRDARVLVAELTAYLNSVEARLRQAELDRAAAQVQAREERTRRKLTAGLAAAVLALVVVGAGSGLWLQRQAAERRAEATRQEAALRHDVEAALGKASELQKRAHWDEARAVLDEAGGRLGEDGPADLWQRVRQARANLTLVGRLDAARLKVVTWVDGHFDYATADRDYATAFREAGLGEVGEEVETVAARVRASAVREQVVAGLDDWAWVAKEPARRAWLLVVARRADPDPWRDRFRDPAVWPDRAALERLAREADLAALSPQLLATLAKVLRLSGADAVPLLKAAQALHPNDFWLNYKLGTALLMARQYDDAVGYLRVALALRPDSSAARNDLGLALQKKGASEEALGYFRRTIALDPNNAPAHHNLGNALQAKGLLDEALAAYRQALALDPTDPKTHNELGRALLAKGRTDEAIVHFQEALRLDPGYGSAHNNLGLALEARGQLDAAARAYRQAIDLDPTSAAAHVNLGDLLKTRGRLADAGTEFRRAIDLDPKNATAHYNLGNVLRDQGRLDDAVAAYHRAIELQPDLAEAYCNLGFALRRKGAFAEAAAAMKRGHELGSRKPRWPYPSARWVDDTVRLGALADRLPAVLAGAAEPADAAERIGYGEVCAVRKLYRTAVRFYAEAFTAEPKLQRAYRYDAACCAALAGGGQGGEADRLDAAERAGLRRRALDWLRADLAASARQLESGRPEDRAAVRKRLEHWRRDRDLAGVRDASALVPLPAEEQDSLRQFWADVEALSQRTQAAKGP